MMGVEVRLMSLDEFVKKGNRLRLDHFNEVARRSDSDMLSIDWDTYYYLEEEGYLTVVGAFDGARLVGYVLLTASKLLHRKEVYEAVTDCFYVIPEYRGRFVFKRMLALCSEHCKQTGQISAIRIVVNESCAAAGDLAVALGAVPYERSYRLEVGGQ